MAKLSHHFNLHKPRLHYNNEPQLQEGARWGLHSDSHNFPKLSILKFMVLSTPRQSQRCKMEGDDNATVCAAHNGHNTLQLFEP